uniref:DUF4806 domain-containing protein n=1 Tax=Neogobius melanostomus TaxID=47308 RepID=A0A8C6T482_9GOBI
MFHIVVFDNSNEVEVVPSKWIKNGECMWPAGKLDNIKNAIKNRQQPGKDWRRHKARIIYSSDDYNQARRKLPEAVLHTDLGTDEEESPRHIKGKECKTSIEPISVCVKMWRGVLGSKSGVDLNLLLRFNLEMFPLNTVEDVGQLEEQLQSADLQIQLVTLKGGMDVRDSVWRIMHTLLSTSLAKQVNMRGINGKIGFQRLKLREVVIAAVRRNRLTSGATEQEIEGTIKRWLHLAPDRAGGRKARMRSSMNSC